MWKRRSAIRLRGKSEVLPKRPISQQAQEKTTTCPKADLLGNSTEAVENQDMVEIIEVSSEEGEWNQNVLRLADIA